MQQSEIARVLAVGQSLWGKRFEMNAEQANVWYMALKHYAEAEAVGAMREHAANSKYMPKPVEIADRCLRYRERAATDKQQTMTEAEKKMAAEVEADAMETDTILDAMTEDEYDRHCRSAAAADWRLEWLTRFDQWRTYIGRAIVAARVTCDIGPDDAWPMLPVPDRLPKEKRGDVKMFVDPVKDALREWKAKGYTTYSTDVA